MHEKAAKWVLPVMLCNYSYLLFILVENGVVYCIVNAQQTNVPSPSTISYLYFR